MTGGALRGAARTVLPFGVYGLLQAAQLVALRLVAPRFFWLDDSQSQFLPTTWWIGRHLEGGAPLLDPDMGQAGNFTADMQYGVLDPLHWGLAALTTLTDNLLVMTWVFGATVVLILGTGCLALLLQARVRPVLAVAAALGIASSGFFLWYGSSWWPMLWSVAWLPWLWVALASRRRPGVILAAFVVWVLLAAGNPYIVPFVAAVLVGQLFVYRAEYGSWRGVARAPRFLARIVAVFGGVLLALPTLLTAMQLSPYLGREPAERVVGNTGFAVPNLLDVLIGGSSQLGMLNWTSTITYVPALATFVLAVPLLALVRWRDAMRSPSVVAAFAVTALGAVLTQLPTTLGVFRYPDRYIVYIQVFGVVFAVLAHTVAPALSRRRWMVAASLLLLQFLLAVTRTPYFAKWHAVALVVAAVALAAWALLVTRPRRAVQVVAGLALFASAAAGLGVGVAAMRTLEGRMIAEHPQDDLSLGQVFRLIPPGYTWGTRVADFRARAVLPDQSVTLLNFETYTGNDRGWSEGLMFANAPLFASMRTGAGYSAGTQKHYNATACMDMWSKVYCADGGALAAPYADTGRTWLELASKDVVVLTPHAPYRLRGYLSGNAEWTRMAAPAAGWAAFQRKQPLIGRVSLADGVVVDPAGWTSGMAYRGRPQDSYVVSTGAAGGRMVLNIPYWPGYRATLGGAPIEVTGLQDSLVELRLPPGVDHQRVELYYDPLGVRLAPWLWWGGAALAVLGVALPSLLSGIARTRRRQEHSE